MKLVELVQFMWETGNIPTDLVWITMILTPKVNADTQGIGLWKVLWNLMKAIIDTHIKKAVTFHNVLFGFCAGRVTGTAIV